MASAHSSSSISTLGLYSLTCLPFAGFNLSFSRLLSNPTKAQTSASICVSTRTNTADQRDMAANNHASCRCVTFDHLRQETCDHSIPSIFFLRLYRVATTTAMLSPTFE